MRMLEISREPQLKSVYQADTDWLRLKPRLEPSEREYDHLAPDLAGLSTVLWRLLTRRYNVVLVPAIHGRWPHDALRFKRWLRKAAVKLSEVPGLPSVGAFVLGNAAVGICDFNDMQFTSEEMIRLLPKFDRYFKRELNAADRDRDPRFVLLPYGLEMEPFKSVRVAEKTTDIFYSAFPNSDAREEATDILQQMKADGYNVDMPEGRLERSEFLQRLGAAWVAVAPQGHGWHSYRQYEAGLLGTVPVSNHPPPLWTGAVRELQDGAHCFYYQVGDGSLRSVLAQALADKERLTQMGHSIQVLCRERHTRETVGRYILEMLGVREPAKTEGLT